ncbi:Protein BZZ1 [Vanrija albida]|uniref:Protein BZZ1 n=1 Tax=Vanrija albida TaxID=181172 RepID=A0ABR3QFB8_9TREE
MADAAGGPAAASGSPAASAPPLPSPELPSTPGEEEPRAWVHDDARLYFLPPTISSPTPAPQALINDLLDVTRDYRDFVDTVGKIESEYGRALSAAVKKFEARLDHVLLPLPGGRKPPQPTLVGAMRAHLVEISATANLHQKRPAQLGAQLVQPLTHIEKRAGESARRLGAWSKDIRARWDVGREHVDGARSKYHAAVRDHDAALMRFRTVATPPQDGSKIDSEWVKLEKATSDAEVARADRKRAYLVALAGEGPEGGGGQDLAEGGGAGGWGEEARALYGHVHTSLLDLLRHQATEDRAHAELLATILARVPETYSVVSLATDEDLFLDWNRTSKSVVNGYAGSVPESPVSMLSPPLMSPLVPSAPSTSPHLSPALSTTMSATSAYTNGGSHPSLTCFTYVAPPSAREEKPVLSTDKREDRNWLVNRWVKSSAALTAIVGNDGVDQGVLGAKRRELDSLREQCSTFSADRGLGDPEDVWERRLAVIRDLGIIERKVAVARAEIAAIEAVLGPLPGPEMAHDFKERQFPTPGHCDACGEKVWSPLKPELACRLCGIALHVKCALHVDPECTGLKSNRRRSQHGRLRRSITSGALLLRRQTVFGSPHEGPQEYATTQQVRLEPIRDGDQTVSPFFTDDHIGVVAAAAVEEMAAEEAAVAATPPTPTPPLPPPPSVGLARVLYSYPSAGGPEISVSSGEVVRVVEDDGSGWVKVRRGLQTGDEGLVPRTYVDLVGSGSTPPADGAGGVFVVAMFDFPPPSHTPGPGETSVKQNAIYELSDEGMAFDAAWCELVVPDASGSGLRLRGVVPKTYVKEI